MESVESLEQKHRGSFTSTRALTHPLCGHDAIQEALFETFHHQTVSGGLLFSGPKGVGKFKLALSFSAHILGRGLGESSQCPFQGPPDLTLLRRMLGGSHGDFLLLRKGVSEDGKPLRDISVEQVRTLIQFMHKTPLEGQWRVVIIDGVEDLSLQGANALLKILEEPPAQAILILISHCVGAVLPTLRSRCRHYRFRPLSLESMEKFLKSYSLSLDASSDASSLDASESFQELCVLSEGRPGYALQLMTQGGIQMYQRLLKALEHSEKQGVSAYAELVESYGESAFQKKLDAQASPEQTDPWEILHHVILQLINRLVESQVVSSFTPLWTEPQAFKGALCLHAVDYWTELWYTVERMFQEARGLSLNRKQVLASVFSHFV